MTSGQLSSRMARRTRPGMIHRRHSSLGSFAANRAREAAYGAFFASVFLLCQSPANALAIDDIRILSKLGEPLMAEVVVTPAAGEVLRRACFRTMTSRGDLPDVGAVRLNLSRRMNSSVLSIAGSRPMREPLSEFVLQVKCPGVPTMMKSFLVMVDPPTAQDTVAGPVTAAAPLAATSRPRRTGAPRVAAGRPSPADPIAPGSRYTVRSGDSLSTIAARVSGRPDWSVWPIAQRIYATNPGAFLLGNPNVIAEAAVISIPRLAEIDMSISAADIPRQSSSRPAAPSAAVSQTPPAAVVAPVAARRPAPVSAAPVTRAAPTARIMPTPTTVLTPAAPLPAMQLTTRLLSESRIKILLRAQGSPAAAPAAAVIGAEPEVPAGIPDPQSVPDSPDSAVTATRAALQPGQAARAESTFDWLWIVVGLLGGLLIGGLTAVSLFRRHLRREYEHDVREAVQRQIQTDRVRQQREQPAAASAGRVPAAAATMDLSPTVETQAADDATVEMATADDRLDFELASQDEPARTGAPETLEMPGMASDLDLELSPDTGKTGQHEVDFDLLEAAYSDDYQAEFVKPAARTEADTGEAETAETAEAAEGDEGDDSDRYYHLENRDPTDESPLPIEQGEDEMGSDDSTDGDGKVVRFRR